MPYIMEFVVMCIALLNGLINPVVLMLSNRDYRKEIRLIFSHRFSLSSEDNRSDTDSVTIHSRRCQNLSKTFQSMQDVHVVPSEELQLKKQESELSPNESVTDFLDICKLQVTVIGNIASAHECRELMSHSPSRTSVDLESPTEQGHAKGEVSANDSSLELRESKGKDITINIDNPD